LADELTPARRILITGLSTYWGGRLAQALEGIEGAEAIIGVDSEDPTRELERTEFVRIGTQHSLLRRIVESAEIDTVVDTRLVVDSVTTSPREAHEKNVIGTMNILAACSGPDSTVRKFIFKSSAHFYGTAQDDPAFFTESMGRPHPPGTPIERDIVEAEASVADFADKNPGVATTILRCANVLGPDVRTSHSALLSLPVVPTILGFDPRYQFVHEDDVVGALAHATQNDVPGVYNVAGDGVLALSEVIDLLGKQLAPLIPPWGTGLAAAALRRFGLRLSPEMLGQLRYGRGLDNRKFKATGFGFRYTTRETVIGLGESMRLDPILRGVSEPYRYEREVEEFLRWSPHVRNPAMRGETRLTPQQLVELQKLVSAYGTTTETGATRVARGAARAARKRTRAGDGAAAREEAAPRPEPPVEHYDDLEAEEVISLLGSLAAGDLETLRDHEREHRARPGVIGAIEAVLARTSKAAPGAGAAPGP
jgi:UDP-glucose 4-epimerase